MQQAADNQKIRDRSQFRSDVRSSRRIATTKIDEASGSSAIEQAQSERLRSVSAIKIAEAEVAAARDRSMDRQKRGQFSLNQDALQAAEIMKSALQRQEDAEKKILDLSKQKSENQKSLVSEKKNELKVAQDSVKSEEEKVRDKLIAFGKLGRGTQNMIREITARAEKGEKLMDTDIDIFERHGMGSEHVRARRVQQGKDRGGLDVLGGLGELEDQAKAVQERNKVTAQIQQQQQARINI